MINLNIEMDVKILQYIFYSTKNFGIMVKKKNLKLKKSELRHSFG